MGPLASLVVSRMSLDRYRKAVKQFFAWSFSCYSKLPSNCFDLDSRINEYIELMWEEGEGRALIANTLSGLQHFVPR